MGTNYDYRANSAYQYLARPPFPPTTHSSELEHPPVQCLVLAQPADERYVQHR